MKNKKKENRSWNVVNFDKCRCRSALCCRRRRRLHCRSVSSHLSSLPPTSLSSPPPRSRPTGDHIGMPTPFDSIPQEVLESIAFFVVASERIGPPRELSTLMLVNRRMYASLSSTINPSFHSRIFATKFDTAALVRRLGQRATTAPKLAAELHRRFVQLGRLRARVGCTVGALAVGSVGGGGGGGMTEEAMRALHEMLWTAYLMMLENDGLNERQLREYAQLDGWLRAFWFEEDGASCAHLAIRDNAWPPNNDISAVTMWLFWFLLRPGMFHLAPFSMRTIDTLILFFFHHHPAPLYPSILSFHRTPHHPYHPPLPLFVFVLHGGTC
jgi:hypothetical protein